jgi:hypothetical protein
MASPESAKGWLSVVMPLLERGGPVVALLLLLVAALHAWYLTKELSRTRGNLLQLLSEVNACKAAQLHYVERYAACHCPKEP